jgi:hypothetical protein
MSSMGRKTDPPKQADDKSKKPTPPRPAGGNDEDYEDGDFSTPKRDRDGNDDEPL